MTVEADRTDAELIAASLRRPELFEVIFDRHAAGIHRYLRRRLGESLAEELTAETFTRAIRARASFDRTQVSAGPWLFGIATNLVRMHHRSEQRRDRAYRLLPRGRIASSSPAEIHERLDAQALRPILAEALGALSADQRDVLLLHAWAGLSHSEIALALEISTATVRKRLHRARANAAKRLQAHEEPAIELDRRPNSACHA